MEAEMDEKLQITVQKEADIQGNVKSIRIQT